MISKTDIQTVLNALQNSQLFVQASSNINVLEGFGQQLDDADEAIALLRAFLAEPSEPVAEVAGDYNTKHIIFLPAGIALEVGDKLFTHPAPSKPEPQVTTDNSATLVNALDEIERLQNFESDAKRLALELECLLMSTDLPAATKWWDSAHEALELHRKTIGQYYGEKL